MRSQSRIEEIFGSSFLIGNSTFIDESTSIFGKVTIGNNCFIGKYVVIGYPNLETIKEYAKSETQGKNKPVYDAETVIGNNVIIQPGAIIYGGAKIGNRVTIGPSVTVGKGTTIGDDTQLMYGSQIHENATIGKNCRIGGFICDCARIGDNVSVFGSLVHEYIDGWDDEVDLTDCSPIIEDNVIIAFNSLIVGKVRVKSRTFVKPKAVVKSDTPGDCIVIPPSTAIKLEDWKGKLKDGKFFNEKVINAAF